MFAVLVVLCGCASPPSDPAEKGAAFVVVHSSPEGALISSKTQTFGIAPVTLRFNAPDRPATFETEEVFATWSSGAQASIKMRAFEGAVPRYSIFRPPNTPGIEADEQAGQLLKRQADEARVARNTDAALYLLTSAVIGYNQGKYAAGPGPAAARAGATPTQALQQRPTLPPPVKDTANCLLTRNQLAGVNSITFNISCH